MRNICIGTGIGYELTRNEEINYIKNAGFDGLFSGWQGTESITQFAENVAKSGLRFEFIHAPFNEVYRLWHDIGSEEFTKEKERQKKCIEDAADCGVPTVIMHASIGMDRHTPTAEGLEVWEEIAEFAYKNGVRIAVENTEGEEYLAMILERFKSESTIGFCWDTGHEQCYNHGKDMTALYGDKLIATHLNDNMGQTSEEMTWLDDSHLLPFDGISDWQSVADRLRKHNYTEALTLEVTVKNKPERTCNSIYEKLNFEEYLALAYKKAADFRKLVEKQ